MPPPGALRNLEDVVLAQVADARVVVCFFLAGGGTRGPPEVSDDSHSILTSEATVSSGIEGEWTGVEVLHQGVVKCHVSLTVRPAQRIVRGQR